LQGSPDHENNSARTDLVQAIYQVAVDPSAYDPLIESWGQYLIIGMDSDAKSKDEPHSVPEDVSSHLLRAFEILDRLGRSERTKSAAPTPRAELLISKGGTLLQCNDIAAEMLGCVEGHSVFELSLSPESRQRLRDTILGKRKDVHDDVFVFFDHSSGLPVPMLRQNLQDDSTAQRLRLSGLNQTWTEEHDHILQRLFGLTLAETTLARRLLNGTSLKDVADDTGRSVDTLRTQLKSIRRKTYTSSQQQLVRIMTGLENLTQTSAAAPSLEADNDHQLALKDRRTLGFRIFGPDDGLPCLFIHNMLTDPRFPEMTIRNLFRHNLRLICPIRPGFGNSDQDPVTIRNPDLAPDRFAADMLRLLSHLGLRRVISVGYMSGAVYGFRMAQLHPDHVAGIVNISGAVPLRDISQIHAMNARQKIIALTARLTPRLLPFMLRAGIAQLDAGGVDKFLNALYRKSLPDQILTEDPEIRTLLYEGFHQIARQGHVGFATDSHHVVRNWIRFCKGVQVPVQLLHGQEDPVVTSQSVRTFAKRMGYEAHIYENTGQLVLHQQSSDVIRQLSDMARTQLNRS